MGNPNWTRTAQAPSSDAFHSFPTTREAAQKAKETGKRQYDNHGELHHPCGCSVGRNLLGEVPVGACRRHGEADAAEEAGPNTARDS